MRNYRYLIYTYMKTVLPALLVCLAGGCVERELTERPADGVLRVDFRWPEECEPDGTQVFIHTPDGTLYTSQSCDAYSHEFRLPRGVYSIRSVNTGPVNADCTDASVIRARTDPAKGTLLNVGNVCCTGADGITVEAGGEPTGIVLHHRNAVRTIRFELDTEEIGPFETMELRLTGIVPSVRVSDGSDAGEPEGAVETTVEVETDSRNVSATRHTASMSVFGWRGSNTLTATVHRADGTIEDALPQEIGSLLDGLSDSGGTVYITLRMPDGGEIGVSVTVSSWQDGTGSGSVG